MHDARLLKCECGIVEDVCDFVVATSLSGVPGHIESLLHEVLKACHGAVEGLRVAVDISGADCL